MTIWAHAEHLGDEIDVRRTSDGLELSWSGPDGLRYIAVPAEAATRLLEALRDEFNPAPKSLAEIEAYLAS